jgi:hypothetical protein
MIITLRLVLATTCALNGERMFEGAVTFIYDLIILQILLRPAQISL